ncbi:9622_t:CDS:2 [Dentiscutata erythropus]|uniref:9622_t:CDS:1 n=1 Tax=Dentiscutata erythropus TaxID=1348616 RepID=A0A9N9IRT6_9GLOM|nr:9622_t:CDS:2 [Dentiscutata erythropus]
METIKYPSNEHLEIVSKTALKDYNKGQLEAILINLSWKAKEIAREYRSEIKIKVKKALTEVFGRKRFPPIEEAHPSVDQINVWKLKDTIQVCFVDLESPRNPDNPNFTWRLAVLEQVYPEETTKNNIAFASVCIDIICNAKYELQQKYVVHKMNLALKRIELDKLEIEIECEGNEANYIEEEKE